MPSHKPIRRGAVHEIRMAPRLARLRTFLALLLGGWILAAAPLGDLERQFVQPPDSARPWVYWMWMDGNLTREGMTADLEAMRRAGIGGVIVMEVDVGIPRGPVKFMSAAWRQLFKHVMAEAERLGLQVTLNAGPGWTGSGGPWVKPEQSMQHIVASATEVDGPRAFDAVLPRPLPRAPYFGTNGLPPELLEAQKAFHADVALLAFPTPPRPASLPEIDEKALYLRHPFSSMPGVKPFLPAPADFAALPEGAAIASRDMVDLTGRLSAEGRLQWTVPPGHWTLLRFSRTSTGANTRPAPAAGLGLESDKFSQAALDAHFDRFVGALLREIGPGRRRDVGWTSLHIDSWEMGAQNWTGAFRDEFRRRRGYDPLRYLPVVTGRVVDSLEVSERFLWDLRETAQELVIENHARHLKELGRREGFGLSIEPYDMNPTADLNLGAVADVPMCEFWSIGFEPWYSCFEAASIAHTAGRTIVAAESFTADDQERWRLHPGNLKALGDWAFCTGVNRIVVHRYAHQPWLDRAPGMTMGPYGVHWERTQTWWEMADAFHLYLARCQWMLRQGEAVADILYLTPEGAPHVFLPPGSAISGSPPDHREYNFDAGSPAILLAGATVKRGKVVFPGGTSYRLLVMPRVETMTPALLKKIQQLVRAGATVVGTPPLESPSLAGFPQCDAEVGSLSRRLWGATLPPAMVTVRRVGKGRVIWGGALSAPPAGSKTPGPSPPPVNPPELYPDYAALAALLRADAVLPDFESDAELRYTHRRDGTTDLYFVANRTTNSCLATASFRVTGRAPELWDPLTGATRRAWTWEERGGRTRLPLNLGPQDSVFVVFRHVGSPPAPKNTRRNWDEFVAVRELQGPWEVHFQPGRGAPASLKFEKLEDWSSHPETGVRYFSGTATYVGNFDWTDAPPGTPGSRDPVFLDLGRVQVMARVRVNGRDVGAAWKVPFRLEITEALQPGANRLEVTVANLWPNRLIGDAGLPADQRIAWTTWNPFKPDDSLLESGWLGPATLMTFTAETASAARDRSASPMVSRPPKP